MSRDVVTKPTCKPYVISTTSSEINFIIAKMHERRGSERSIMPRNFSFKLPDDLAVQIEAEVERKSITATDVIRRAVEEYFQSDEQRRRDDMLLYEIIRTRSALMRRLDMESRNGELSEAEEKTLYAEVDKDVDEYLAHRRSQQKH